MWGSTFPSTDRQGPLEISSGKGPGPISLWVGEGRVGARKKGWETQLFPVKTPFEVGA